MGSLRHYFETQSDLLAFAMELVVERVGERVATLDPEAPPRRIAEGLLHEVLPLDPERCAEMRVWLAFTTRSLVDPRLRELRDRAHDAMRGLCRNAVELLGADDLEREAERLHALVDGLALHAVHAPDVTTPERQIELIAAHLDSLPSR